MVLMSKVLVVLAHPKNNQHSNSIDLYETFIKEYRKQHPDDQITVRDLFAEDEELTGIDSKFFEMQDKLAAGKQIEDLSAEEQHILKHSEELLQEFIDHDKYVFVNPMYNMFLPYQLKMCFDNVTVAHRTFKYTEDGQQVGLMKGHKALHLQSTGSPHKEFNDDFANQYLEGILNFNGVDDVTHITVESMMLTVHMPLNFLKLVKEKQLNLLRNFNSRFCMVK